MKHNATVCTKKRNQNREDDEEPGPSPTGVKEKVWVEDLTLFRKIVVETYEEFVRFNPKLGYNVKSKRVIDSSMSIEEYKLREVSFMELQEVRSYGIPAFIMKDNEKLYYAWIPFEMRLMGSMSVEHKCAPSGDLCLHLSPLSDEKGGCAKVRDRDPRIELYDWITKGYETVNTVYDAFIVLECEHFERTNPKDPLKNYKKTIKFKEPAEVPNRDDKTESFYGVSDPFLEDMWNRIPKKLY